MSNEMRGVTRTFPAEQARGGPSLMPKRPRDDDEQVRAKLADQSFTMKKYPDPLLPRQSPASSFLPKGVTAEMEKGWLAKIKAAKEKEGSA